MKKTPKFTIFANRKHLKSYSNINITINNQKIKQGKSIKYLWITLSEDLSWHDHIDNLITRLNHRLGLQRRVKSYLHLEARCILYTSLILPLLDYADIIWGDKNNSVLMNSQILENKAVKLILQMLLGHSPRRADKDSGKKKHTPLSRLASTCNGYWLIINSFSASTNGYKS